MSVEKTIAYTKHAGTTLPYVAAALAFSAELIHLLVLPNQYAVWMGRGIFFFVVAACQGALAVSLLFGPGRKALTLGIVLNLFVGFVWAFTRIVGLPAWTVFIPLPLGALDLTATAAEVALVVLLVRLRRSLPPNKRRHRVRRGARRETTERKV